MHTIDVGEFIEVPVWKTFGQVVSAVPSIIGEEDSLDVILQEHPEQLIADCRTYRLRPGDYNFC